MRRILTAGLAAAGFYLSAVAVMAAETAPPKPAILIPEQPTTTQYASVNGFPDHNGAFSAMMIVIPEAELAQFNTPGGNRQLSRVNRAEAGAMLAIKLVFTGLSADRNGNGEVTYDLKVLGPDGQVYAGSNYRRLEAVRGPLGSGKGVFDNRTKVVNLVFEPQDPPGVYTIQAVAHDEVAELDVPLTAMVELLPSRTAAPEAPPPAPGTAAPVTPSTTMAPIADTPAKVAPTKKKHRRQRRH